MKIVWAERARHDLHELNDFYLAIDADLADRMIGRVEREPDRLLDFPGIGSQTQIAGWRKWRVRDTPYLLFYRVERDRVIIARVLHAARDRKW